MAGSLDLDRLVASTIEDYVNGGELEDQVFTRTPFLTYVQNHLLERKATGDTFRENFSLGRNENFQGYGPYQTWTFTPDRGYGRSEWKRKEHVITATISGQEEEYNSGPGAMWDVVKDVTMRATKSLQERIEKTLIQSVGGPKLAHGLELLIGDASSTYTTVGGLDCRDAPWWQSLVKRPGYAWPVIDWENIDTAWTYPTVTDTTQNPWNAADTDPWQVLTLDVLDEMVDLLSVQDEGTKRILLTTKEIKRAIIRLMKAEGMMTLKDTTGTLVGGYDNVVYQGMTIIDSIRVERGDIWVINSEDLKVRVHPNRWLKSRPWISPFDQDAKYMAIFAWFQMWTPNRRGLAKIEKVSHTN